MHIRTLSLALAVALLCGATLSSTSVQSEPANGRAAFLFEYRPKPEMERRFEDGYRRHLEWHRRNHDTLPWYAWSVTTGDRVGVFIDGTLGIPFSAFDQRIEPAADAVDFDQTASAFATPLARRVYRLRPELSGPAGLDRRTPATDLDVLRLVLNPGSEALFEDPLRRLVQAGSSRSLLCYQLVAGGEMPGYLIAIPHRGWGQYEDKQSLSDLLSDQLLATGSAASSSHTTKEIIARVVVSETWTYRPELSLIPD